MKWRLSTFITLVGLFVSLFPAGIASAVPACTLCILEIQTRDTHGDEAYDAIIVANVSAAKISSSGIQLRFYNGLGIQTGSIGVGTFDSGQTKVYANQNLAFGQNTLQGVFDVGLHSSGGSVQLVRTSGTTTTVYDRVGWGDAQLFEGSPAPIATAGSTIARMMQQGIAQDTDNNGLDFEAVPLGCAPVSISEIQPFVAAPDGSTQDAWLELVGITPPTGDCQLITAAGDLYIIPETDMPQAGERVVIDRGVLSDGTIASLHLGDAGGMLWLAGSTYYGPPLFTAVTTMSFPKLSHGQTWAAIDGLWRATFEPTPASPNVLVEAVAVPDANPTACDTVRISEILPNPTGDDADKEWIELYNDSDGLAMLATCRVVVGDDVYMFDQYDGLQPHEYRSFQSFVSSSATAKRVSLNNSSDSELLVTVGHVRTDGSVRDIQALLLYDGAANAAAPEGQSWARFEDGWRWLAVPTPGLDNATVMPISSPDVTEFPAEIGGSGDGSELSPGPTITITELLPNPAAPATDDSDEYVELYNPNDQEVDLTGYTLQTGDSFSYSYTFPKQIIGAHAYNTVTSGATSISLSNTSGRARLLDAAGNVVSQTDQYVSAPEGIAWAFIDGAWKWTQAPTAGVGNTYVPPLIKPTAKAKTASVKSAKTTTPKASTTKAAKPAKESGKKPAASSAAGAATTSGIRPLHTAVLAGVGLLALLYAAYEYRTDIANRIYKLRSNRAHRRKNRA